MNILTPEQVRTIAFLLADYDPVAALVRSHEALREQLADARADIRVLLALIPRLSIPWQHSNHQTPGCFACARDAVRNELLARPGVQRLLLMARDEMRCNHRTLDEATRCGRH